MQIGAHVSSSGGIHTAIDRAEAIGAESVQVFTQSPRTWRQTNHDPATFDRFRERRVESGMGGVLCHALYLCNFAAPDDAIYEKSIVALRSTMEIASAIGADGVVVHVGSHLGAGLDKGLERVVPALEQVLELCSDDTWLLMENSAGAGGTIGRSIDELATIFRRLDAHPRLGVLPRLVPPLRLGRRRHRPQRARCHARRARLVHRLRSPARAACQRFGRAARVEPRPAREHRRGTARREPRRLPRAPTAPGPTGRARDRRAGQARPRCQRDPEDEGDPRARARRAVSRYRWVILAAGTLAQASFSAALVGLPALAPVLRSHYHLSLGQVGIVLGAISFGMIPTLLPWGLLADRIGERTVIGLGLGSAGIAMSAIAFTVTYAALVALLVVFGALGSSINAASGRAVMGWFAARTARARARDPSDRRADRRRRGSRRDPVACVERRSCEGVPRPRRGGDCRRRDRRAALAGGAGATGDPSGRGRATAPRPAQLAARDGLRALRRGTDRVDKLFRAVPASTPRPLDALSRICARGDERLRYRGTHRCGPMVRSRRISRAGRCVSLACSSPRARRPCALLIDAPLAVLVPTLAVAGVLSLSWNGVAFTAAAEMAGTGRSGAALGFQQTVLGVIAAIGTPAFAALVAATSWRAAFFAAAALPALGLVALRRVSSATEDGRSRGTSAIPPAIP